MASQQSPDGFDALAVIGAVTGVAGLALEGLRFRRDRPRLIAHAQQQWTQVQVGEGAITSVPGGVRFYITNEGRQPVVVTGLGVGLLHHRVTRRRLNRLGYRLGLVKSLALAVPIEVPEGHTLNVGDFITFDWTQEAIDSHVASWDWLGTKPQMDPTGIWVSTSAGKSHHLRPRLEHLDSLRQAYFDQPTFNRRRGRDAPLPVEEENAADTH